MLYFSQQSNTNLDSCAQFVGRSQWRGYSPPVVVYTPHHYSDDTWAATLHWRHNDHDGVSNHEPYGCLLNRLFGRRSKKAWKLRVTGLCVGNSPGPVNSPHKGPVTRKMFSFDDVIMNVSRITGNLPLFAITCISPATGGFPLNRLLMRKAWPCHGDIMW